MDFIALDETFGGSGSLLASACSDSGAIVYVIAGGTIYRSSDYGVSFTQMGSAIAVTPWIACTGDGGIIYLNSQGNIKISMGGETASVLAGDVGNSPQGLACTPDGIIIYSCDLSSSTLRKSTDSGFSFVDMGVVIGSANKLTSVACSNDGVFIYTSSEGDVYFSNDSGLTFSVLGLQIPSATELRVSCSGDGLTSYVVNKLDGELFASYDYGANYESINSGFSDNSISICSSDSAATVYITTNISRTLYRTESIPGVTTKLIPENEVGITTGNLLPAEVKADIVTGALLGAEAKADIVTGNLLGAEVSQPIITGNLLTAIPLPPTSGFPLNYARIGYDNALVNGAASATSDNINSAKMLTPSTYDKWRPTTDSVATLVGTLKQCNYVGIAAHNLGADGVTLTVKVSDGGTYTTVYSQLVTTDNALFIRFVEGTYSNVELTLTGSLTAEIGVVFLGLELEMMRPIFTGHKPANLNATDVMTPQISDGGQFLGKQIVRQGYATAAEFQHLTDEWYRDKFQPFVEHAKVRPYFWAWNLLESPDDVVYGWTNSNIGCSYMGIRNWLQVSFDIEAHA